MIAFVDAALVLVLLGVAAPVPLGAVLPAVWLAFTTPLLIRADLSRRRLPNIATVPAIGLVVGANAVALVVDTGVQDPAPALFATVLVAAGGLVSARLGGVGLGDVKLATATVGSAALVGPDAVWTMMLITGAAGGAAALGAQIGRWRSRWDEPTGVARGRGRRDVPYGPCLLVGYWIALTVVDLG